jgi:hypothetical protein
MFSVKVCKSLKGYIVIYVFFFGMLSMVMVFIIFKLQMNLKSYLKESVENSLRQDRDSIYKEYLFAYFKRELVHNNVDISKESIMNFLNSDKNPLTLKFEDSLLTFDKKEQLLLIIYPHDIYYNRVDYFNFSPEEGKLLFYIERSEIKRK